MKKWTDCMLELFLAAIIVFVIFSGIKGWIPKTGYIDSEIRRDTLYIPVVIRDTVILAETRQITRIDTVMVETPGSKVPVEIQLPFELKTYEGEHYSLDVSGYKPKLERIDIFYDREKVIETRTNTVLRSPAWQAGITAGYYYAPGVNAEYVGARFRYNWKRFSFEGTGAYSPSTQSPFVQASVGFDLIQK